ncbi:hypothetical protein [Paraflavitalea speifideaquila]|uniref:hypothetical protein n=1 Tax=Paraflavitalea speifideaquila TaxID=3076558 RepID=UPI0028ED64FB|nr:hypothetical protein [Paraflavitalea speifideiaquila]
MPLNAVIHNGALKLPDYYTDTLPDAVPYRVLNYDRYHDTLCLDPAGFTYEIRLRLRDEDVIPNYLNDLWHIRLESDPNTSGRLLVSIKLDPTNGVGICTHLNDPKQSCLPEYVPRVPTNVWRTVRLQFRGRDFKYYIDNNLMGTRILDMPMTKLYGYSIAAYAQKGEIDYIRISDVEGRYLFSEEFTDALNLAIPDPSLRCGGCEVDYARYFNKRNNSNLPYAEIVSLYKQRGITLDACEQAALTLCGRAQPAFPATLLEAIDNCSDSTFFIMSKAQDLYRRYTDSLKGQFDKNYLAKCMQAYKYEQFTVRHAVSEYHYTLYYYDQAGNLVKTIAPAGVRANYDSLWLNSVAAARAADR